MLREEAEGARVHVLLLDGTVAMVMAADVEAVVEAAVV